MKKFLAAIAVVSALAGCGSSAGASNGMGPPPGIEALKSGLHQLTTKLGCLDATVTKGSGYAQGAAYTSDCAITSDDPSFGSTNYSLVLYASANERDAWVRAARGVGGFYAVGQAASGGFWAVQAGSAQHAMTAASVLGGAVD